MNEGAAAARARDWQKALDAYKEAQAIDDTAEVKTAIANATRNLAAATTAADKKKQYDELMATAQAATKDNKWQEALDAYEKAQDADNTVAVRTAIANAKKKLYDQYMAEGEAAGKANEWEKALDAYTKAQAVDNTQAARTAINNARRNVPATRPQP